MGTLSLSLVFVLLLLHHASWNFCSSVPPSSHLCLPDQKDALLQFKNTHDLSAYLVSWNESIDCCSWEGVICDNLTGHVIAIDLSYDHLSGPLLANDSLFHLHNLRRLDLRSNDLEGAIPSEFFSRLVSLTHLDLSYNSFSGLIPSQIGLLSNLVSLELSYNFESKLRFDGKGFDMLATNLTKLTNLVLDEVDMSDVSATSFLNLTSSLETLILRSCGLHGEFPSQVFQLPNLKHVDLGSDLFGEEKSSNEQLTGYLPNTNLSSALEFLDLSETGFRGSIPDVFGNNTKLTSLRLNSCNFSGPIPISMFNLTQVTILDLSYNHLEGPLPNHASGLQLLKELGLSDNSISGGVPSWLFTLSSLPTLDLKYNKLDGPIGRIQNKASYLKNVDLSHNNFHGPIPDSVFDLTNLSSLDLSSNNLSGVIKSDMLSKLASLQFLDVSNNSLLSLRSSDNGVNYSFPCLEELFFSGCSVRQFPSFFRTSRLSTLDLSNNKISGGISKWEAQGWENLGVLNLSYNYLTSLEQFPGKSWIVLDLSSNLLEGSILSTCLNNQLPDPYLLSFLLISENKLTGNIPSSICNWTFLIGLDLSKNSLSGTIPDCFGNFSDRLQFMDLQVNNLYGKIPDSFFNDELTHLFLNDNQLEGLVPKSLANSTSLKVLNLGNNKLTDSFPHWLASLPSLQVLILKSNRFHGSLPHSMASSNFSALQIIDLSGNEFSGPLPTKIFRSLRAMTVKPKEIHSLSSFRGPSNGDNTYHQISVNVTTKSLELELKKIADIFVSMDLSNNRFCGRIPEEVGQLISLHMLNLSHNNFTGPIPASFGNLLALESLDLSSNKLSGRIPSQMTKLTFLEVLNLSENRLVGPIPHGNQFDTFDNGSYIGNFGLCDLPLSKKCAEVPPPAPLMVEDEGSALPFFWQVVLMGYGSGVVLGVSLGYIVFTTGRPWWFVRMVKRDLQPKFTKWMIQLHLA